MLQHLVLMNVLVPIVVLCLPHTFRPANLWRSWPWATAVQIALLWGWHSPGVLPSAMASPGAMLAMHASLVACSAWFWLATMTMPAAARWRGIFALLVTGKLFCLLGALLVFAPNLLFGHLHHAASRAAIADQQLAGMLMLIACPLTYVSAGIVMAAQWFARLEAGDNANA